MKIIGLTGGIGSGKSTVSSYLREKGCYIIDADKMSRELTAKGGSAIPGIKSIFGDKVFNLDGSLDRKKLSEIVFSDKTKKDALEKITTKIVIDKILKEIKNLKTDKYEGIIIIDAPLLFEFGMEKYCHESWLVYASQDTCISRVMKRDGLSKESIEARMRNQMSLSEKKRLADYIIENSSDLSQLYHKVNILLERFADEKR